MTTSAWPSYAGYRFPAEIISHAVWLYFRFPLSNGPSHEQGAARSGGTVGSAGGTPKQWSHPRHVLPRRSPEGAAAIKKPPKRKQKLPRHKASQRQASPPVFVIDETIHRAQAIKDARIEMMPSDVRAECERLGGLTEEEMTPEDHAWFDMACKTYHPSEEACRRQLALVEANAQTRLPSWTM